MALERGMGREVFLVIFFQLIMILCLFECKLWGINQENGRNFLYNDIHSFDQHFDAFYNSPMYSTNEIIPIEERNIPFEYQLHGTTTLAFKYRDSIIICVDSKASIGNYVGSRTVKKIFPISSNIIATMAGGAADCMFWIRRVARNMKLIEEKYGTKMTVFACAKTLAANLREYRGAGKLKKI
jgi:20S proteasome subunit beta 5